MNHPEQPYPEQASFTKNILRQTREALPAMAVGAGTRIAVDAGLTYVGAATLPATAVAVGIGSAVAAWNRENKIHKKSTKLLVNRHITRHESVDIKQHSFLGKLVRLPKKIADGIAHGREMRLAKKAFQVDGRRGLLGSVANVVAQIDDNKLAEAHQIAISELGNDANNAKVEKKVQMILFSDKVKKTKEFYLELGKKRLRKTDNDDEVEKFAIEKLKERLMNFSMAHLTVGKDQELKKKANQIYMAHYQAFRELSPEMDAEMRRKIWTQIKAERKRAGRKTVWGVARQQLWKGPLKFATGVAIAPKIIQAWQWAQETFDIDVSGVVDYVKETAANVYEKARDWWSQIKPERLTPAQMQAERTAKLELAARSNPESESLTFDRKLDFEATLAIPAPLEVVIGEESSITQELVNAGILDQDFTQPGGGRQLMQAVEEYCLNCDKLTPAQAAEIRLAIEQNPQIPVADLWNQHREAFAGLDQVELGEIIQIRTNPELAAPLPDNPQVELALPPASPPADNPLPPLNEDGIPVFGSVANQGSENPASIIPNSTNNGVPTFGSVTDNQQPTVPLNTASVELASPEIAANTLSRTVNGILVFGSVAADTPIPIFGSIDDQIPAFNPSPINTAPATQIPTFGLGAEPSHLIDPYPIADTETPQFLSSTNIGHIELSEWNLDDSSISTTSPEFFSFEGQPLASWQESTLPGEFDPLTIDDPKPLQLTYLTDQKHGGQIFFGHSGWFEHEGKGLFEGPRRFLEGGSWSDDFRFSEVQMNQHLQDAIGAQWTLTHSGQPVTLELYEAGYIPHENVLERVYNGNRITTELGGGDGSFTFLFCGRSHIEALQMFDNLPVPSEYHSYLQVLNNPGATGEQTNEAVQKLAEKWLKSYDPVKYEQFRWMYDGFGESAGEIKQHVPDYYQYSRYWLRFRVVTSGR